MEAQPVIWTTREDGFLPHFTAEESRLAPRGEATCVSH